ncbi:MAG: tetratricopeptide repeat protein [Alphaproteobacteria bacterium]
MIGRIRTSRTLRGASVAVGVLFLLTGAASADYDTGKAAYAQGDYAAAFRAWKPIAEGGNPVAQFALGTLYEKGQGVRQNGRDALRWYTRSAKQNFAEAQLRLAYLYAGGTVVPRNDAEAAKWMKAAAANGHVMGQLGLGALYEYGRGVPRDLKEAARLYDQVARATQPGDVHDEAVKGIERVNASMSAPRTAPSSAIDPSLVGKWEARLAEPEGGVTARFTLTIAEDGSYALKQSRADKSGKALPSTEDTDGRFETSDGRYAMANARGTLNGTYRVVDRNTFEMIAESGKTIRWRRVKM